MSNANMSLRTRPASCAHSLRTASFPAMDHNRRSVLKLGVVDVGVESAALPNGVTIDLAVIRHPGASAIVALDADGAIPLLTQYRHAFGECLKEVPAGCINQAVSQQACDSRAICAGDVLWDE